MLLRSARAQAQAMRCHPDDKSNETRYRVSLGMLVHQFQAPANTPFRAQEVLHQSL